MLLPIGFRGATGRSNSCSEVAVRVLQEIGGAQREHEVHLRHGHRGVRGGVELSVVMRHVPPGQALRRRRRGHERGRGGTLEGSENGSTGPNAASSNPGEAVWAPWLPPPGCAAAAPWCCAWAHVWEPWYTTSKSSGSPSVRCTCLLALQLCVRRCVHRK